MFFREQIIPLSLWFGIESDSSVTLWVRCVLSLSKARFSPVVVRSYVLPDTWLFLSDLLTYVIRDTWCVMRCRSISEAQREISHSWWFTFLWICFWISTLLNILCCFCSLSLNSTEHCYIADDYCKLVLVYKHFITQCVR